MYPNNAVYFETFVEKLIKSHPNNVLQSFIAKHLITSQISYLKTEQTLEILSKL